MSGAVHTPGPWCVGPVDDTLVSYVAPDGKRHDVAAMCGDYSNDDEWPIMEGNARLCAAALDLLAAAEAQEEASALAIAASEACPDGQTIPANIMATVQHAFDRAAKLRRAAIGKARGVA